MVTDILQIVAALALLALALFLGYLLFAVLPRLRSTLIQVQEVVDRDLQKLLADTNETIKQLNEMMPKLDGTLEHAQTIGDQMETLTRERIDPITADVQEVTHRFREDVEKIDQTVTAATAFSQKTLEIATFYRGKLFEPVIEIVSFWNGLKAGIAALKSAKSKTGGNHHGEA